MMAFVRVKVGEDEIVVGTFAPQPATSLLTSNFVLSQVAERLQDLSDGEVGVPEASRLQSVAFLNDPPAVVK